MDVHPNAKARTGWTEIGPCPWRPVDTAALVVQLTDAIAQALIGEHAPPQRPRDPRVKAPSARRRACDTSF